MQYDVATPEDYIAGLAKDWRLEKLEHLRSIIAATAPHLKESIHYKMLGYSDDNGFVFHLNAQKHYVSLYVGDTKKLDPSGELLAGLNTGNGCIRFSKTASVDNSLIEQLIMQAIALWDQGENLDC